MLFRAKNGLTHPQLLLQLSQEEKKTNFLDTKSLSVQTLEDDPNHFLKMLQKKLADEGNQFIDSIIDDIERMGKNFNIRKINEIITNKIGRKITNLIERLFCSHLFQLIEHQRVVALEHKQKMPPLLDGISLADFMSSLSVSLKQDSFILQILIMPSEFSKKLPRLLVTLCITHYPDIASEISTCEDGETVLGLNYHFRDFFHKVIPNIKKIPKIHELPSSLNKTILSFNEIYFKEDEKKHSIEEIGRGTYAIVYAAHFNEEEVAVKFLPSYTFFGSSEWFQICFTSFLHEALALHQLKSPYISTFKGIIYHKTIGYGIVMKRYTQSLYEFLRNTVDIPMGLRWRLSWQLISAMCYMHKNHWLHGDIKIDNIFLEGNGDAVIGDFGNAHPTFFEKRINQKKFQAPEVINGAAYNTACDIYSLGLVLKEIHGPSSSYQPLIMRCLDVDPAKRPTAEMLLEGVFSELKKRIPGIQKEAVSSLSIYKLNYLFEPEQLRQLLSLQENLSHLLKSLKDVVKQYGEKSISSIIKVVNDTQIAKEMGIEISDDKNQTEDILNNSIAKAINIKINEDIKTQLQGKFIETLVFSDIFRLMALEYKEKPSFLNNENNAAFFSFAKSSSTIKRLNNIRYQNEKPLIIVPLPFDEKTVNNIETLYKKYSPELLASPGITSVTNIENLKPCKALLCYLDVFLRTVIPQIHEIPCYREEVSAVVKHDSQSLDGSLQKQMIFR